MSVSITPTWAWREPARNTDSKWWMLMCWKWRHKYNEGDRRERSYLKSLEKKNHILTKYYGTKENKMKSNTVPSLANLHLPIVSFEKMGSFEGTLYTRGEQIVNIGNQILHKWGNEVVKMNTVEWNWNLKYQYEPNIEIHSVRQANKKIQTLVCMG